MSWRAGALDREIIVEKKSVTTDPNFGTEIVTWAPLAGTVQSPERFRAEVQDVPPGRSESVALGLQVARNQTRMRMRWRPDIDSTMRITLLGDVNVVYQIVGGPAEVDGRKERIEVICERYSS